jgi:hypothetical protein
MYAAVQSEAILAQLWMIRLLQPKPIMRLKLTEQEAVS